MVKKERVKVPEIRLGLLGMGTVGTGVVSLLHRNGELMQRRAGCAISVEKILVRDAAKKRDIQSAEGRYTENPEEVLGNPDIDLVVELMGGVEPSRSYMQKALEAGKGVVTANKDVIARHGEELLETARRHDCNIWFEGSVGGGIPLVRPLKNCLAANRVENILGIVNGTTNYILTRMDQQGMDFEEALREAQELGFAEPDPTNDVDGWDAAYKAVILGVLAFGSFVPMEKVYVQGIRDISFRDLQYARELGYTIKLLAVGDTVNGKVSLRVHPALLPLKHPLAAVYNEFNALFLEGDAVGEIMFYGKGAGAFPTASAVVGDIIEAARSKVHRISSSTLDLQLAPRPVLPMGEMVSSFYLRLQAYDRPGVFAALASTFGEHRVSLDMIIQKRSDKGKAEIVLITHKVTESRFWDAVEIISNLSSISKIYAIYRVIEEKEQS